MCCWTCTAAKAFSWQRRINSVLAIKAGQDSIEVKIMCHA